MPYQSERAPSYRIRVGTDVPEFGGMNTRHDPSALPPTQFQELVNTRFKGGRIVNRKGSMKINNLALTGTPTGAGGNDYGYFSGDGGYISPGDDLTDLTTGSWSSSPLTNLYGYYSLEEVEAAAALPGTVNYGARDYSGNANHLTAGNAFTDAPPASGVAGTNALTFDFNNGSYDSLAITDNDLWMGASGSFSISIWIRPGRVGQAQSIIGRGMGGAAGFSDWYMYINASDNIMWKRWTSANNDTTLYDLSGGTVSLNSWSHVVVTHDASGYRGCIYHNSLQYSSGSFATGTAQTSASGLITRVGAFSAVSPGPTFHGRLDELAIWTNRVLTPSEVIWLYNSGSGRTYADLAAA